MLIETKRSRTNSSPEKSNSAILTKSKSRSQTKPTPNLNLKASSPPCEEPEEPISPQSIEAAGEVSPKQSWIGTSHQSSGSNTGKFIGTSKGESAPVNSKID